ncbi:phosphodiesterase [Pinisolibacter sp.]|uniref:phosphodiesterase n=1 Tax=Pinisolibacter sp. TaxID=2172024 RepID=UPI002FDE9A54
MILAHLTDLHIRPTGLPAYRVAETNKLFARAIDALLALEPRPDAVVITGDLTDCGLVEEYEVLAAQLARLPMPVHLVLGNHDRREAFHAVFGEAEGAAPGFTGFDVAVAGVRVIGIDTVVPGASFGMLCDARLDDLEARLAARPEVPTLVAMHHPPAACGIGHMDRIALMDGAERLAEIIARHPNVERMLAGHHHRPIQSRFAGTILQVAPSVAHQVVLDLSQYGPPAFVMEPAAYLVHALVDGAVVSHQAYVERHDGPYPFVLDADYPGAEQGAS